MPEFVTATDGVRIAWEITGEGAPILLVGEIYGLDGQRLQTGTIKLGSLKIGDLIIPSPVFAISNATVLRSWSDPDPRCGIGLTIQTDDSRVWTYCHLSYLQPTVQPGASLAAGDLVGLVGHTGDASGPHLHLQLQPATSYPQNEAWFKAFAGTAFSVLTPGGDVIREAIGAFPSLTLAEGEYVLIARHEGQVYTREFKVESGQDRDIEVLAKK